MQVDNQVGGIPEDGTAPGAPLRASLVRTLVGQTQSAGLAYAGNRKSFFLGQPNIAYAVGGGVATLAMVGWQMQVSYPKLCSAVILGSMGTAAVSVALQTQTMIVSVSTTTGGYTQPAVCKDPTGWGTMWAGVPTGYGAGQYSSLRSMGSHMFFPVVVPVLPTSSRVQVNVLAQSEDNSLSVYLIGFVLWDGI